MPSSEDFIAAARSYIGTPWKHQGRSRRGIDCVGLVVTSLRDLGLEVTDGAGYRRTPRPDEFLTLIRSQTEFSPTPAPGTIGIFRGGTQPCHVGIFATKHDRVSLIHAYALTGVVMEEPFDHQWPQLFIEARFATGVNY